MSKPLTEKQKSTLRHESNRRKLDEVIDAALDHLEFLERKVAAANEVMDVIRSSLPLLAQHYDKVEP